VEAFYKNNHFYFKAKEGKNFIHPDEKNHRDRHPYIKHFGD